MRVEGDPDGCRRAARELLRAADAVAADRAALRQVHEQAGPWSGSAATRWQLQMSAQAGFVDHGQARLRGAGERLLRFADELEELQSRTRSLAAEAEARALPLDGAGWTPPVPRALPADGLLVLLAREDEREQLIRRARRLLAEQDALHDELSRDLAGLHDQQWVPRRPSSPKQDVDVAWGPSTGDLPSAALLAAEATRLAPAVRPVVSTLARHPAVGSAVTAATDVAAGKPVDDAVIKAVLVNGAAWGSGAAVGGAVLAAGAVAPVAVPVAVAVTAGLAASAAVGYVGVRLFDAAGHHLPFVDGPSTRRPRRTRTHPRPAQERPAAPGGD